MGMERPRPLDGITIFEIGHSVAAPYAGMILADLGARVIKVERPPDGDYARGWGPPFWGDTASAFHALNRGKQGITVDFKDPDSLAELRKRILDEGDAVIQNLKPGVLARHGLDSASLVREKPELIWCDLTAFGAVGPLADKPGYDPLVQALSGVMSVTGEEARPPVRVGISLVDMGAGMWAVIGILSSLLERRTSGRGSTVSTSLFETGLAWMTIPLAGYNANGEVRKPHGSGVAEIVPYEAFRTKDAWLMIAAGNDRLFSRLCTVLDRPDLGSNPDYVTNAGRVVNRHRLLAEISAEVSTRDAVSLASKLDAAGVPNAQLQAVDQVMAHEQTKAVDMIEPAEGDSLPLVGLPICFDGIRPRSSSHAPALGEHNGGTAREPSCAN